MKDKYILPRYKLTDQILLLATDITAALCRLNNSGLLLRDREKEEQLFRSELEAWLLLDDTVDEEDPESPLRQQAEALLKKEDFQPELYERRDVLQAHLKLLHGIAVNPGSFRLEGPAWSDTKKRDYAPPSAKKVPDYVRSVLEWGNFGKKVVAHPLIQASIIGFALDVVQPFDEGSRLISLLWQRLILEAWNPVFARVPFFTTLLDNADGYNLAIRNAVQDENAGKFIEFNLLCIREALERYLAVQQREQEQQEGSRFVNALLETLGDQTLSTKELMEGLKLKHRPTFRDHYLLPALQSGQVEMTIPDKPNSCRQKYRRCVPKKN